MFKKALDQHARTTGNRGLTTTDCRGVGRRGLGIYANRVTEHTGGHHPSHPTPEGVGGGQRRVTPRQTCPRPNGFGRNLRSKTRWFTGFCNSHQVSHFATFFIDARAEISVAESRLDILKTTKPPARAPSPGRRGNALSFKFLGAIHAGVQYAWEGRSSESTEVQHARHSPPRIRGRRAARPSAPQR